MTHWVLKRNDTKEWIELPQDMRWLDEFDWAKVAQTSPEYTLGGAIIIEQGTKLSGRPITLGGEWIWLPRITLETLRDWTDIAELDCTLEHYDGRTFNVIFDRPALSNITPVMYATPEDGIAQYEAPQIHLFTI